MVDSVESEAVVISINDKLRPLQPLSSGCCIYRVPENLRKVNEDAYRPWIVSIGPFYHNDAKLKPMQEQNLRYLQSFLTCNEDKNIGDYVQFVSERQEDIRNCYNHQIELDNNTFVEMLLLDAAFIIEFLKRRVKSEPTKLGFIGKKRYLTSLITRDMILEENQLPFFFVNDIYNLSHPGAIEKDFPFIRYARVFANFVNKNKQPIQDITTNAEIKHFADLLRLSCLPSTPEREPNHSEDDHNTTGITFFPSVTELHEAGLKFMVSTSGNLLDISFNNGVLEIPRLKLMDRTETVFRNLVVFEQLHLTPTNYISDYITFLDGLINTAKDVDILVQKGIIHNCLGSNEKAAKLINSLCTHIIVRADNFYYSGVCNALNKYMTIKWHKWRAILKHTYFSHPWAVISVVYAIVLLILTFFTSYNWFYSNNLIDSQPQPVK